MMNTAIENTTPQRLYNTRSGVLRTEIPFMPIKLRDVLANAGITQSDFSRNIVKADGEPVSVALTSLLLGRNQWPTRTPRPWLEEQIRQFLKSRGVAAADDADLFELNESPLTSTPTVIPSVFVARMAGTADSDQPSMEPIMLSAQAKKQFGLFTNPFINDIQRPDDVFMSADQRYVREAIRQGMKHSGSIIAVIGESGSGKSTIRRDCLEWAQSIDLPASIILPRTLDKRALNTSALAVAILSDIAPEERPKNSVEGVARQVEKVLMRSAEAGNSNVMLIEEAHDLSIHMLRFLKRFWDIDYGYSKLVSIILVGQPELKDRLNANKYPEAREFINRCEQVELLPLDSELGNYLTFKFARVNRTLADIADNSALDAIRQRLLAKNRKGQTVSMVYPLYVHNLVVRAMNFAAELGAPLVTADIVKGC